MSNEQTTSTEQSSSEQQTQQTQTEATTLDQVYKQFNVEEAAQSFQPQRTQQTTETQGQDGLKSQSSLSVPDPVLNPDAYKQWAGQQNEFVQKALSKLEGELTTIRVERLRAKEEADIKNAVSRFKSVVGDDIDDDIAEVALGQKARKDQRFLSVYQNRDKNPAAWKAAVSAYANEFKSRHQFKVDPNIAEAQRAAKLSTGSQTTDKTEEPTGDDKVFAGKTGREFDAAWRRYIDTHM